MCVCLCVFVHVCVCIYECVCMCICCPTSSSLLQRILVEAHHSGTKFRVVVVDGRPWREGREMLRRLVGCGLDCSYVLVSAASFIMREVCNVRNSDTFVTSIWLAVSVLPCYVIIITELLCCSYIGVLII
jgi:hypothetical protein